MDRREAVAYLTSAANEFDKLVDQIRTLRDQLEDSSKESIDMADVPAVLTDAATRLRTAVTDAKARVEDTPELAAFAGLLDEISAVANGIDPETPGSGIVNDGSGGLVPADGGAPLTPDVPVDPNAPVEGAGEAPPVNTSEPDPENPAGVTITNPNANQ